MRPIAVVIGGAGSLGKSIVRCFRNQQYKVLSVDYKENLDADHSFLLSPETFSSLSSNGLKNGTSIPHWLIEGNRMETELIKFVKVMPTDYKRVLNELKDKKSAING